jgi:hypothetical protein
MNCALVDELQKSGYQWVCVKAQHGYALGCSPSYDTKAQIELLDGFVPTAEGAGIEIHGWGYNFGNTTTWRKLNNQQGKETDRIVEALIRWRFRSWTLNAEHNFKVTGGNTAAVNLVNLVRETLETHPEDIDVPIGLSSYRFPSSHTDFPFAGFLQNCDFAAPQVYWQKSKYAVDQLEKSVKEWKAIEDLPFVVAGTVYPEGEWWPTGEQVRAFNQAAKNMPEVIATCYWEHYYPYHNKRQDLIDALNDFVWEQKPEEPTPEPTATEIIQEMRGLLDKLEGMQ